MREKRGLAYSVGSYNEQFTDQGLVATYVGTREDNVEEACSIIGTELAPPALRAGLGRGADAGPRRASRAASSSPRESTAARMTRISRATLFGLPIESLDEMLAKVDAIEVDDADRAGRRALRRPSASRRPASARDEDRFRAALAPVSESLVAA